LSFEPSAVLLSRQPFIARGVQILCNPGLRVGPKTGGTRFTRVSALAPDSHLANLCQHKLTPLLPMIGRHADIL